VATFDFASRSFTFTEDRQGAKLDADALYRKIADLLDRQQYTATVSMESEPITPRVTRAELMNTFARVSTYTTQTTSDASRNNNINLACQAVTGTAVMPGETFSFNQATGQRTLEKGYLMAAAISGGTTVDEVGGGVCQVSSTLFNAAAMADLTILKRSPHTWPSNYVEKGRDATVNWPTLDFAFRNDRDTPVFIVAYYRQRECTVEIYGCSLGSGNSITLETQLISVTEPPVEAIYEQNPELPPGTVQEKKKPRTGYAVDTYRVYRHNGVEYRREKLCTSNYQMIQQVIEYN
jgi:vancomycin resistance protein YoaR